MFKFWQSFTFSYPSGFTGTTPTSQPIFGRKNLQLKPSKKKKESNLLQMFALCPLETALCKQWIGEEEKEMWQLTLSRLLDFFQQLVEMLTGLNW